MKRKHLIFISIIGIILVLSIQTKAQGPAKWDSEKIKGQRFKPHPLCDGNPFFTDRWETGNVILSSGEVIDGLALKYDSYKDELLYLNKVAMAQIQIDKATIHSFACETNYGKQCIFRKQSSTREYEDYHFYQVLYDGKTDLVCHRKTELVGCSPYYNTSGILKNEHFVANPQFYFYSPEKGYCRVRLTKHSLLFQFEKTEKKEIKRILRKRKVKIHDENSFILAWSILDKSGLEPKFKEE